MEKQFLIDLVGEEAAEAVWEAHQGALADREKALRGDFAIRQAIFEQGGRNETAIRALLDGAAILSDEDPAAAAVRAVQELRRQHGYLFRQGGPGAPARPTVTRADLAAMSMEEYRRYRKGM